MITITTTMSNQSDCTVGDGDGRRQVQVRSRCATGFQLLRDKSRNRTGKNVANLEFAAEESQPPRSVDTVVCVTGERDRGSGISTRRQKTFGKPYDSIYAEVRNPKSAAAVETDLPRFRNAPAAVIADDHVRILVSGKFAGGEPGQSVVAVIGEPEISLAIENREFGTIQI